MCDAVGCSKTTPGGGYCRQCEIEQKWEQGEQHALDGEYSPECFNCSTKVKNKQYHPRKPGAVLCEDCYQNISEKPDAIADGGVKPSTTSVVEIRTTRGMQVVEVERQPLATDAATIDQARKCGNVSTGAFNGGRIR